MAGGVIRSGGYGSKLPPAYGPTGTFNKGAYPDPRQDPSQQYFSEKTAGQGQSVYRTETGRNMTDQEYQTYMRGQEASKIQTGAQKDLAQQQIDAQQRQAAQAQAWKREDAAARQAAVNGLMSRFNFSTQIPDVGAYTSSGDSLLTGKEDAARSAAFARAKDQAGLIGRSALTGLQESMAGRGITGSGLAGAGGAAIVNTGAQQLGDINREQLIQNLAAARARASEQLQAGITARGQDISARGQNIGLMGEIINSLINAY